MVGLFIGCLVSILPATGQDTWIVDDDAGAWADYNNIQDAVDVASNGDLICVYNGTYSENILFEKSIDLIGNGSIDTCIIDNAPSGVIYVLSTSVNITGFTITNSATFSSCGGSDGAAVRYSGSSDCSITQCRIINSWQGIYLGATENITVSNNRIHNNRYNGTTLEFSGICTISNNKIYNNENGIGFTYSCGNLIANNIIASNTERNYPEGFTFGVGFSMCHESENNIIRENSFIRNDYGLFIWHGQESNGYTFLKNNFIDNNENVYLAHSTGSWDNGVLGNYWSDFDEEIEGAFDNNADGIVDSTYLIPHDYGTLSDDVDNYPSISIIGTVSYGEWIVDDDFGPWADFNNIQDAVDGASNGDTIYVYDGYYNESIEIYSPINLIGNGSDSTIIENETAEHIIYAWGDNINISGFTICGAVGSDWSIGIGLYLTDGKYCNITENVFSRNDYGVDVHSYCCIIQNNIFISNNINGTNIFSGRTSVLDNEYYFNNVSGISAMGIYQCNISGNFITHYPNQTFPYLGGYAWGSGIVLQYGCDDSRINNNTVTNYKYGIVLFYSDSGDGNDIYHNAFIDNEYSAYSYNSFSTWDLGSTFGGNYWSDFDEPSEGAYDTNDDGIIDSSYQILCHNSNDEPYNIDHYPLAHYGAELTINNVSIRIAGTIGNTISVTFEQDGENVGSLNLTRLKGAPSTENSTIEFDSEKQVNMTITFTSPTHLGANPVWIYYEGNLSYFNTFIVQKQDSTTWYQSVTIALYSEPEEP